jgi:hypothetical protein
LVYFYCTPTFIQIKIENTPTYTYIADFAWVSCCTVFNALHPALSLPVNCLWCLYTI